MYKILIVEDDYTIAELLKKGLSSWGFDTEYVTDFQTVASPSEVKQYCWQMSSFVIKSSLPSITLF